MEEQLKTIAMNVRKNILHMIYHAKSGHPGGSLSAVEIGVVLYFHVMNTDNPGDQGFIRDRFILSKGHAAPLLYALLIEKGLIEEELISSLRKLNSPLQGHPCMGKCPGIEIGTGSLGQGLSVANGVALANKMDNKDCYTFCLLGDGELNEGQNWEAFMFASHYCLSNLIAVVDRNRLQIDGNTEDVMALDPLDKKFLAFGWDVYDVNGHSISELVKVFDQAKKTTRPSVIIANTIKGKGVSFMENNPKWHGKAPDDEQYQRALTELGEL